MQTLQTDGFLCFTHDNIKILPPHYCTPKIISAISSIYIFKVVNLPSDKLLCLFQSKERKQLKYSIKFNQNFLLHFLDTILNLASNFTKENAKTIFTRQSFKLSKYLRRMLVTLCPKYFASSKPFN